MKTTLKKIWDYDPCPDGWEKLLVYLGKSEPDNEPLDLIRILESNGIEDAIWALRAVEGHDREIRLFSCWCACQSLHIFERENPNDMRPRMAIESAALFAEGLESSEDLAAAGAAAWAAAWAAASGAACASAWAAAWDAAWDAVGDAAWAAAWAAARDAQKKEFRHMCLNQYQEK
jgi:hypothetical protein